MEFHGFLSMKKSESACQCHFGLLQVWTPGAEESGVQAVSELAGVLSNANLHVHLQRNKGKPGVGCRVGGSGGGSVSSPKARFTRSRTFVSEALSLNLEQNHLSGEGIAQLLERIREDSGKHDNFRNFTLLVGGQTAFSDGSPVKMEKAKIERVGMALGQLCLKGLAVGLQRSRHFVLFCFVLFARCQTRTGRAES